MKHIIIAITGATGSIYALQLLKRLSTMEHVHVHLIISFWGEKVMKEETGRSLEEWLKEYLTTNIEIHSHDDLSSSIASGSNPIDSMVVIPCTMGTLGSIANGLSSNLIERAASVTLKEKRSLILVARETPLSSIHLQNMLTLSNCGALILPPVPAFYCHPKTIDDIIQSTVDRVLTSLQLTDTDIKRWSNS